VAADTVVGVVVVDPPARGTVAAEGPDEPPQAVTATVTTAVISTPSAHRRPTEVPMAQDAMLSLRRDGPASTLAAFGGMAERPNARLLKSLGMQVPGGSNPSPSAGQTVFSR
jgi:hypothetical protein